MSISPTLLEILVCPRCKSTLNYQSKNDSLLCENCSLLYPIREGIPILLEEEAFDMKDQANGKKDATHLPVALFKIKEGPNQGEVIKLPLGACKAIGRKITDADKTQLVNLDPTVPLDDFTKKLVLNYISKKMGKAPKAGAVSLGADLNLGEFKRLNDLVLNDPAISRLHAMIFFDENGVGILDLVSRNGTFVNGEEIESKPLQNGDLIEIGSTKIVFSLSGA